MLRSLLFAILLCAQVASAQDVPPETLLQSNALFAQGKRELDANQLTAACASFAESYRLLPRGGTLLNLGLCRELTFPLAREHIAALESQLSFVALALPHDIDPSLVALRLDGSAIAREEWNAVPLAPGVHVFSAEAVGFQSWSTKLSIGDAPARLVVTIGPLVPNSALALETPPQVQPFYGPYQPYAPAQYYGARQEDPAVREERLKEQRLALEGWFLEAAIGVTASRMADPYAKTLRAFGYDAMDTTRLTVDAALGVMLSRRFGLVFHYDRMEQRRYVVDGEDAAPPQPGSGLRYVYSWHTQATTAGFRFRQPLVSHWVVFFAEATAGLAFTKSALEYETAAGATYLPQRDTERNRAFAIRALGGFQFGITRYFGVWLAGGYMHAPTLTNEVNETHNGGGPVFLTGLRLHSVKGWW